MNLGPHAAFIVAAYAVGVAVIAGTDWLDLCSTMRAQRRMLAELEARGDQAAARSGDERRRRKAVCWLICRSACFSRWRRCFSSGSAPATRRAFRRR